MTFNLTKYSIFFLLILIQFLTRITKGGPADRAGARNEDRLIEVNGANVEHKSHEEVVTMIKASVPENAVTFKVVYTGTE